MNVALLCVGHDCLGGAAGWGCWGYQGWSKNYPTEPAFFVPKLLEDMVAKGHLGRKTGQGFYKWAGNKVVE